MAGVPARILTNSQSILGHAGKLFARLTSPQMGSALTLRLWVSREEGKGFEMAKPCFRGVGRFLFAGFGGPNFLVVDLAKRSVSGRFDADFADDEAVWRKAVFTIIVAMVAPAVGASVLHCAAVEREQRGLILAGSSGSGKSTLSLALGRHGFGLVSDDRTCFSYQNQRLLAWSMGGYWKLRPDAAASLQQRPGFSRACTPNRQDAWDVDPESIVGLKRSMCCEPEWLLFLERQEKEEFDLTPISADEAADRLEDGLHEETPEDLERQRATIRKLVNRPCHILRFGGDPEATAQILSEKFRTGVHGGRHTGKPGIISMGSAQRHREDPLRRFTPLPHKLGLKVMGRYGELLTNDSRILECARALFPDHAESDGCATQFRWRIVAEDIPTQEEPWPAPAAFSADGLRVLHVDRRSFIAVDTENAEGAGIISTARVKDAAGLASIFMAGLFYATAPALGLTPLSASCVSFGEQGLLLLGLPGAGKTTCAYAARKLGLEFHADMVTFLEIQKGAVLAHGEFWPALFRRETAQLYPELLYLGRPLKHDSQTFLAVDKSAIGGAPRPVTPTVALHLERSETDSPRLSQLSEVEFSRVLATCAPFEEEARFRAQRSAIQGELEKIPAYRLIYRRDPAEAAVFCKSLLRIHEDIGAAR